MQSPGVADGAIHFAQLFSYQYHRPWPSMLDFGTTLTVFGASGGAAARRDGAQAATAALAATFALAAAFAVWGGDVYCRRPAPLGSGRRDPRYYASRTSEDQRSSRTR